MAEGKWIENCVVTGKITINQEYNNSSDFTTSTEIVQLIGGVVGKMMEESETLFLMLILILSLILMIIL